MGMRVRASCADEKCSGLRARSRLVLVHRRPGAGGAVERGVCPVYDVSVVGGSGGCRVVSARADACDPVPGLRCERAQCAPFKVLPYSPRRHMHAYINQ